MRKKKVRIVDPSSPASTTSTSRLLPFRRSSKPSPSSSSTPSPPSFPSLLNRKPWQPRKILDPGSDVVLKWNRVFLVSCLVALFLDPLYFYLQSMGGPACVALDLNLGIVVTFFRTVADLFYLAHMILKFRTAFVAPSSRVFGKGELVRDSSQIAMRYLRSDFAIDLVAMLPIPQAGFLSFFKLFRIFECPLFFLWVEICGTSKDTIYLHSQDDPFSGIVFPKMGF